jgi:hypothetical protein
MSSSSISDEEWSHQQYEVMSKDLRPFRMATIMSSWPVGCAMLWLLPSFISLLLTFAPHGNEFTVDLSYGQFKIDGDPTTIRYTPYSTILYYTILS